MKIKKKPLSIYIHIPFCKKKCLYCDFLSAPACGREREVYVKALLREISLTAEKVSNEYEVISVFFGGGTPSLLNTDQIERILSTLREGYYLAENAEITMECNPATADYDKLSSFRKNGINRLSIGLQSADDAELKQLGRIHDYNQFLKTYFDAREAGFCNINIDIMSALPGQTYESYLDTLEKVTALEPEHISAYSLIIEEGTPFYERYGEESEQKEDSIKDVFPDLPDEDTERKMYHKTKSFLQKAGFSRYEISNYAKKGYECRHNISYWTGIDYLGFGIGAASYLEGIRFKNSSDIQKYQEFFSNHNSSAIDGSKEKTELLTSEIKLSVSGTEFMASERKQPALNEELWESDTAIDTKSASGVLHSLHEEIQILSLEEKMEEFMFLGLRLKKGISINEFQKRFQKSIYEVYQDILDDLIEKSLLIENANRIYLSQKGTDVANYVMMQFLLD